MFSIIECYNMWHKFFFEPIPMTGLGAFRICLGIFLIIRIADMYRGNHRALDFLCNEEYNSRKQWQEYCSAYFSFFHYFSNHTAVAHTLCATLVLCGLGICLGWCGNFCAMIAYLCWTSIVHRNMLMFNSGASLTRILLFFMIMSPCDTSISLTNYLYDKDQFSELAIPWAFRLMQIQVLVLYMIAAYHKINEGADWLNGVALNYVLNNNLFNRYNIYKNLQPYTIKCLTYSILLIQLVAPIGLCFIETKNFCIMLLCVDHLIAEFILRINYFGILMAICMLLFL